MLTTALDTVYGGGLNMGAMGAAMGRSREKDMAEKAEAIAKGQSSQYDDEYKSKIRGVAEEFVSVFMNQIMKSMRATVNENPEMHGDNGEKFFQEMLDTEQSKTLSKGSGYGLTDLIYQSLLDKARVSSAPAEQETESATAAVEEGMAASAL